MARVGTAVDVPKVRGLSAETRPVVDELEMEVAVAVVDERQGGPPAPCLVSESIAAEGPRLVPMAHDRVAPPRGCVGLASSERPVLNRQPFAIYPSASRIRTLVRRVRRAKRGRASRYRASRASLARLRAHGVGEVGFCAFAAPTLVRSGPFRSNPSGSGRSPGRVRTDRACAD